MTVPVVPRSDIRQVRRRIAPRCSDGGTSRARRLMASRIDAAPHGPSGPMFLWTMTGIACRPCLPQRRAGLSFASRFESKIVGQENPRLRLAAPPSRQGSKVMLRPRTENVTRCHGYAPSRRDASVTDASISRLRQTRPFNHHRTGFRSRRLAPLSWPPTAAVRQPVIKRSVNAQQNAYRCDPSGRDPGGCSARPSCRGIRLRVSQP